VKLADMVFRDGDVVPSLEDGFHRRGVAGDLLFIAAGEGLDLKPGQQMFDLAVGQLAAFDPGGGADALDRGHPAQGIEPLGGKRSQGPLSPFEFIDLAEQCEQSGRDLDGPGVHGCLSTPYFHPNTPKCPRVDSPEYTRLGRDGIHPARAARSA